MAIMNTPVFIDELMFKIILSLAPTFFHELVFSISKTFNAKNALKGTISKFCSFSIIFISVVLRIVE